MTRLRWFCSYCGALTERRPDSTDERVRCRAHSLLPREVDLIPPEPLESLPVMGDDLGCEIAGNAHPPTISRSARSAGSEAAHHVPPSGEDVQATRERGV